MLHGILFFTFVTGVRCANLPDNEFSALYDLYNSTNGLQWDWADESLQQGVPWNFSGNPNPCVDTWQGVNCSFDVLTDEYHVQHLKLPAHNLVGRLPDSIQSLTALTILGLPYNKLSGTVPAAIGNMANLQNILLSGNDLTGTMPAFLGQLTALEHLELFTNNILKKPSRQNFAICSSCSI